MASLPEMKASMILGFKLSDTEYHVFQALAWSIRTDFRVRLEDDLLVCGCTLYRFDDCCVHTKMITDTVGFWVSGISEWEESGEPLDWVSSGKEKRVIAVADENAGKFGCMNPDIGDVNLFNLLWLLTEEKTESKASGFLNPNRIYEECLVSVRKGLSVQESEVIKAGKKIKPLEESEVERIYDSSLGEPFEPEAEEEDFEEEVAEEEAKEEEAGPGAFADPESVTESTATKFAKEEAKAAARKIEIEKAKKFVEAKRKETKAAESSWKRVKRPDPRQFYIDKDVWEQYCLTINLGKNLLVTGPSGSGKSESLYIGCKAMRSPLEAFNMGAMSEPRTTLIGNTHFNKEKGTWFAESRFVKAVQKEGRSSILLDEVTRADRGAYNILLPLMDRQGYLALDESEDADVIRKSKETSFLGTANIGMEYVGTDAMDKALEERFGKIVDLFFPPDTHEVKLIESRTGCSHTHAKRLIEIATTQRDLTRNDMEFTKMISTRMLLEAGEEIAAGIEFKTACKFCLLNHFSDDGTDSSDRTKVQQIIQRGG